MATEPSIKQWFNRGAIQVNGEVVSLIAKVSLNDEIVIQGQHHYRIANIPDTPRWHVEPLSPLPQKINGLVRAHCGQHKCLTMYVRDVFARTFNSRINRELTFTHFFARVDQFYRYANRWSLCSISGHRLNLDLFNDIKVTRFVRDPRDMVVSSYFYHKRSAENWCSFKNPKPQDYHRVNGAIPSAIPRGESLASYLNSCSLEEGLKAEIEFRRPHFESMMGWPTNDNRVKTFRYEDIIGNEAKVFFQMCRHLQLPVLTQIQAASNAYKLSAARLEKANPHIRNARSGQWRNYFSPQLTEFFKREHGELLESLAYPVD